MKNKRPPVQSAVTIPPAQAAGWILFTILAVAAGYVHTAIFAVWPDPWIQPDSPGYFEPAFDLLLNGHFGLPTLRTPAYPLFLFVALKLTGSFSGVLVVQHLFLAVTAALAGFLYYRFYHPSPLASAFLALIVFVHPEPLLYAHAVMTDNAFTLTFMIFILAVGWGLNSKSLGPWILAGILAPLMWAIRPVAMASALALILLLPLFRKHDPRWRQKLMAYVLPMMIVLTGWAGWNKARADFFGLTDSNGEVLFGSTGYLLDLDKGVAPDIRETLEPIYETQRKRMAEDHAWVMYHQEGPVWALRRMGYDGLELDRLLKDLAFQALRQHPVQYGLHLIRGLVDYLLYASRMPNYLVIPKDALMGRGLAIFFKRTEPFPQARTYLVLRPENEAAYFHKMRATDAYPFEPHAFFSRLFYPIMTCGAWLPVLSALLSVLLLRHKPTRRLTAALWLIIAGHLTLSFIGGGLDGRYAMPVLPLYVVLFFAGGSRAISEGREFLTRRN